MLILCWLSFLFKAAGSVSQSESAARWLENGLYWTSLRCSSDTRPIPIQIWWYTMVALPTGNEPSSRLLINWQPMIILDYKLVLARVRRCLWKGRGKFCSGLFYFRIWWCQAMLPAELTNRNAGETNDGCHCGDQQDATSKVDCVKTYRFKN